MASPVTFKVIGIPQLMTRLQPRAMYLSPAHRLIKRLSLRGEREARSLVPKDTGALARSIQGTALGLSGKVSSPLGYARPVEEGRRAGARMPPPAALAGWARRHGMPGAQFAIARAIAKRGIKGRFFMKRTLNILRAILSGEVKRTAGEIESDWKAGRR